MYGRPDTYGSPTYSSRDPYDVIAEEVALEHYGSIFEVLGKIGKGIGKGIGGTIRGTAALTAPIVGQTAKGALHGAKEIGRGLGQVRMTPAERALETERKTRQLEERTEGEEELLSALGEHFAGPSARPGARRSARRGSKHEICSRTLVRRKRTCTVETTSTVQS